MVGSSGQEGYGPVDLFSQHDPGQGVRPGLGPEGQDILGARPEVRVETVGPADQKDQPPHTVVSQSPDLGGKVPGAASPPPFVAGDDASDARWFDLDAVNATTSDRSVMRAIEKLRA